MNAKFYLSPDGRASRKQYWLWLVLPLLALYVVAAALDVATGDFDEELEFGPLSSLVALLALIPSIMVQIKRLHDRDKSAWWFLILFIPIIGALWFAIELGFLRGTPGPNRYGRPVGSGSEDAEMASG